MSARPFLHSTALLILLLTGCTVSNPAKYYSRAEAKKPYDALIVPGRFPLSASPWTLALWMNVAAYYDRSAADGWAERYTQQVVACNDSVGWSVWLEGAAEDSMYLKLMDEAGTFYTHGYVGADCNVETP